MARKKLGIEELLVLTDIEEEDSLNTLIKTNKVIGYQYQVFFDEEIGEPKKYRGVINKLNMGTEDDVFEFVINSVGGYLSSSMAIIEGIKSTESKVRAIIIGECHSAASLLALSCHEIVITDAAHMLVHTSSYETGGNAHLIQKHVDFSSKYINKILDSVYTGFLTDEELEKVKMGVEYWFDAVEIGERLTARLEYKKSMEMAKNTIVKRRTKKST